MIKRLLFLGALVCGAYTSQAFADCTDHIKDSQQSGAFAEMQLKFSAKPLGPNFSKTVIGEIGNRSARGNGTIAWRATENHWFKVSGEYLTQKLRYDFGIGKKDRWCQQAGVGAEYQQLFECGYFSFLNASGYYSYAPSKSLSTLVCPESPDISVRRHIAGSHAWGGAIGGSLVIWCDALLSFKANYDKVEYQRKFDHKLCKSGFGATLEFEKRLFSQWDLKLLAELRAPFQYYFVSLTDHFFCRWQGISAGLFASYTNGEAHLPSHAAFGIQAAYSWQPFDCCQDPCSFSFLSFDHWAQDPAFYAPEVLAIAEKVTFTRCQAPTSTALPDQTVDGFNIYNFDTAQAFTDPTGTHPLTFSATGLPPGGSIDSSGIISGTGLADNSTYTVTVTATNSCGSTSQTFTIFMSGD